MISNTGKYVSIEDKYVLNETSAKCYITIHY